MASSTSFTISGSRAEVGSSKSMTLGCIASARAMATRCCWPPESCPGSFLACSGIFTRSSSSIASASASAFDFLRTRRGPRVMLSSTVMWGNRLKDWNTIPHSRRISWMLRTSSESSIPSTMIVPLEWASRRLMHRIIVDLPPPDGPMTHTTSCLPTTRLMSRRAWKSPKNLSTPSSVIMGSPVPPATVADLVSEASDGSGASVGSAVASVIVSLLRVGSRVAARPSTSRSTASSRRCPRTRRPRVCTPGW